MCEQLANLFTFTVYRTHIYINLISVFNALVLFCLCGEYEYSCKRKYVSYFNEAINNCEQVKVRASQQSAMQARFQSILIAHHQKQQLMNQWNKMRQNTGLQKLKAEKVNKLAH